MATFDIDSIRSIVAIYRILCEKLHNSAIVADSAGMATQTENEMVIIIDRLESLQPQDLYDPMDMVKLAALAIVAVAERVDKT